MKEHVLFIHEKQVTVLVECSRNTTKVQTKIRTKKNVGYFL